MITVTIVINNLPIKIDKIYMETKCVKWEYFLSKLNTMIDNQLMMLGSRGSVKHNIFEKNFHRQVL